MKTKTITLYEFKELSEDAKEKAINQLWDINVNHEWWDCLYGDAEIIGLKLTEFDLDRNRHAKGKLLVSLSECCELIINEHGPDCITRKTAEDYLKQWVELVKKYSDGVHTDEVAEHNYPKFDHLADELESDFTNSILEDYSILLQNEYEYLTSKEQIIETIEANEYTFTEDGKLEN